jgi:hypothetical protein
MAVTVLAIGKFIAEQEFPKESLKGEGELLGEEEGKVEGNGGKAPFGKSPHPTQKQEEEFQVFLYMDYAKGEAPAFLVPDLPMVPQAIHSGPPFGGQLGGPSWTTQRAPLWDPAWSIVDFEALKGQLPGPSGTPVGGDAARDFLRGFLEGKGLGSAPQGLLRLSRLSNLPLHAVEGILGGAGNLKNIEKDKLLGISLALSLSPQEAAKLLSFWGTAFDPLSRNDLLAFHFLQKGISSPYLYLLGKFLLGSPTPSGD